MLQVWAALAPWSKDVSPDDFLPPGAVRASDLPPDQQTDEEIEAVVAQALKYHEGDE